MNQFNDTNIGLLPTEWGISNIGSIADVTKLAGYEYTEYFKYSNNDEIIALRALNVREGVLDLANVKYISRETSEALPRSKLFKHDLLFTYIGANIGQFAIVPENDKFHLAPNICRFRCNQDYHYYFLYSYMRSSAFRDSLEGYSHGSSQPTLPMGIIRTIPVPVPPLPEQKAIASVLSSLDDKIDLLHRQNKTLEAMAETLFRQWFIEEAKEDWEALSLKDLVSVIDNRGKTPPYLEEKTAHPIIEVNALTKMGRAIDYSVIRKYVTKDTFDTWFRQYLQPLDIVLSTVGSIGSFGMFFGGSGCVAQNIIGLKAKQKVSNYFLYQWLVSNTDEIKELDIGSVQPSIKVPHLLSLSVKIPPLEKLELFDAQIKVMVDKIVVNAKQIQTLEQLRDTLLPKLMSGEVRVQYQTQEVA